MYERDDRDVFIFHAVNKPVGSDEQLSVTGIVELRYDTPALRELRKALSRANCVRRKTSSRRRRVEGDVFGCLLDHRDNAR